MFLFGSYFLFMEGLQLIQLGPSAYFDSFWNFIDIASYCIAMMIPPFALLRIGLTENGYVPAMVRLQDSSFRRCVHLFVEWAACTKV